MSRVTRLCLLLSLMLSGCASIPQNLVTPVTLPTLAASAHRPNVHVSVSHFYGDPDRKTASLPGSFMFSLSDEQVRFAQMMLARPTPMDTDTQRHTTQEVRQILKEADLFERVSMTDDPLSPDDYQLFLEVYEDLSLERGYSFAGLATVLTLGIFPSTDQQQIKLRLYVFGPGKTPLGRLGNRDVIERRAGLINLAHLGSSQEKAESDTLKRQLDALLKEVVSRGLIPELALTSQASGG